MLEKIISIFVRIYKCGLTIAQRSVKMENIETQQVKHRFGIIGNSNVLNRAIEIAIQVAKTDLSVLITGESGVGKENIAQIIHQYSARKHNNYIAVNCGAIPKGTMESELFGHEKGSYTDAKNERKGYFEVAEKGTIFLDEIGELPLDVQAKLLRVLENHEYIRVGSSTVKKTDVRIVAATNIDIENAIKEGKFREDLYYRLNTIPISMPALRDRKEDIILLFRKFASDFAEKYRRPSVKLDEEAQAVLREYYWPGNVRQLKNIAEQLSVLETGVISKECLLRYLPNWKSSVLPALTKRKEEKTFENEREILYQVLFDMKKDMSDLRRLVKEIIDKQGITIDENINLGEQDNTVTIQWDKDNQDTLPNNIGEIVQDPVPAQKKTINKRHIEDTEEYVEESLSLEEAEKEMIKKALDRHNGKRKLAAKDLDISERTLYRKIKQLGLE